MSSCPGGLVRSGARRCSRVSGRLMHSFRQPRWQVGSAPTGSVRRAIIPGHPDSLLPRSGGGQPIRALCLQGVSVIRGLRPHSPVVASLPRRARPPQASVLPGSPDPEILSFLVLFWVSLPLSLVRAAATNGPDDICYGSNPSLTVGEGDWHAKYVSQRVGGPVRTDGRGLRGVRAEPERRVWWRRRRAPWVSPGPRRGRRADPS